MTESFLLTFLKNVYSLNVNYCVVCLRTSEERRLVKPHYVKDFTMSINQPFIFNGPNHMACYICERQAAAALRYRKASSLATYAIDILSTLKNNHKKCAMIRDFTADEKNQTWLTAVLHCESEIMQQRAHSQLLLTEVLVVSSPTAQPESSDLALLSEDTPMVSIMGQPHITSLGESRDLYVVPDDAPTERVSESWELTPKPEEGMGSIIIYDEEDDDPININPDIQPTNDPIAITNNPIPQQNPPLSVNATKDAPNMLKRLLQNPKLGSGEMSMLDTNTIIESAPTEFILHPIIFNSGMMTVPSLSANIVNGKLIMNNTTSSNLIGTPQLALQVGRNLDVISDPNKVTNVLRVLSHQDAEKVHIFTGAIPSTSQTSSGNVEKAPQNLLNVNKDPNIPKKGPKLNFKSSPVIEVGNTYDPLVSKNPTPNNSSSPPNKIPTLIKYSSKSKNPSGSENPSVRQQGGPALLRADRIDWEDKIPMDVISFVDENDTITKRPRYSNNALGISDVVSLNNDEAIIDLC